MILKFGARWTCIGQLYAVATLRLGKTHPGTYRRGRWISTRSHTVALDKVEITLPYRESNYDSLAVWYRICGTDLFIPLKQDADKPFGLVDLPSDSSCV